jgi:ribonucleoside-diphosphate reductase alpha chain
MTIDLKNHRFSPYTVIVSRVQRVIDDPAKISPISCTMVSVEDSYYDIDGNYTIYDTIAGSRLYATKVLKGNAGVSVDLSKLRPKGTKGSGGLIAQGVTNFMHVYSAINSEVRRGNSFKNGAVVLCLAFTHPDFEDFLEFGTEGHETQGLLPWAKKGVTVNADMWLPEYADRREKLFTALAKGQVFVSKEQYSAQGDRLYDNVCTTGDTWVSTTDGLRQVKDLVNKPFSTLRHGVVEQTIPCPVMKDDEVVGNMNPGFFCTGLNRIFKVDTSQGYSK